MFKTYPAAKWHHVNDWKFCSYDPPRQADFCSGYKCLDLLGTIAETYLTEEILIVRYHTVHSAIGYLLRLRKTSVAFRQF